MARKKKKNAAFEDILSSISKYFIAAVALMLAAVCLSGIRFVKSGNVALILRFGKLVGSSYEQQVHEPGLLLAFPYIIDEVVIVPTGSIIEQRVDTYYSEKQTGGYINSGYVITGDRNIVTISAVVKYKITNPVEYALGTNSIESVINAAVSNAMAETAAGMSADDILTSKKDIFTSVSINRAQEKFNSLKTGVQITNLELTKVSMPAEVVDVYNEVTAASVKASTLIEQARNYRDTTLPAAQSSADKLISDAKSGNARAVAGAKQALSEFWGIEPDFENNKQIIKTRLYNEKMAEIISKIGKVKIVRDGDSKIIIN